MTTPSLSPKRDVTCPDSDTSANNFRHESRGKLWPFAFFMVLTLYQSIGVSRLEPKIQHLFYRNCKNHTLTNKSFRWIFWWGISEIFLGFFNGPFKECDLTALVWFWIFVPKSNFGPKIFFSKIRNFPRHQEEKKKDRSIAIIAFSASICFA